MTPTQAERPMATSALQPGAALPDLDIQGIMRIIPHRYPMLLLDRLVEAKAFESAVGIKNVTANEPYFTGHFPAEPIMPGVLIVEAMAQTAAALAMASAGEAAYGSPVYFMGVDEAKFRRPVRPGDQLRLTLTLERQRLGVWKFKGIARVGDKVVAEALLTARLAGPAPAAPTSSA
jgi:3-hydroxyacyl-[acyl-carrier-protein] dehydratase